jgi:hypothetical protein
MFNENTQYFTLSDVINTAISKSLQSNKKKESKELSMHIINDMTYSNIWNTFVKWCTDQAEMGYLLNIYPLGSMFYVVDKQFEGISIKVSEGYLKENDLRWDDSKFYYEKIPDVKVNSNVAQVQKLNLLAIASELNLPKIYVQSGLNNLFKAVAFLLSSSASCLIDLGFLGNLHCVNKGVYHIPTKLRKDSMFNKKTTVKALLGKFTEDVTTTKDANIANDGERERKNTSIRENENFMKSSEHKRNLNNNNVNYSNDKMKLNMGKIGKESKEKITFEKFLSPIKKITTGIKKGRDKIILVPMREHEWYLNDMLSSTFKKGEKIRILDLNKTPVLFNAYSNTKAAPFTSEKTQIPISHRIGSFYSLPLQNFIIDKTHKSVKKLYDEYFYKYKNVVFETPATEEEEYLSLLGIYEDVKKIEMRRGTYKLYKSFLSPACIPDDCISEIKESWLVGIVKMCLRAYNINNQDKYGHLLNASIREIISNYKDSMRKSILDYILKHPELREKLGIPVPFRKLKEYSEDTVKRPSDEDSDWKRDWNLSKLRISNNLMIMCENITKVLKYYVKNLKNTSYLELNEEEWTGNLKLTTFIDNQKSKIEDQKNFVSEEWKKYVENVLKENKIYKDQLILYFKSISGLMSSQLRKLIINSLEKYYNYIQVFKKVDVPYASPKLVFDEQFNPEFPFEKSFLEVEINAASDNNSFCFSDELSDVHNKLVGLVNEIVKCSQDVERPDNMFIKNLEKRTNLWEVPINDNEVSSMINEIDNTIKENLDVVNKVLELYEPFLFVLQEKTALEKFKASQPKREDIKKKILYYEEKLKVMRDDIPNSLYMNMIKIDCTAINKTLRDMLYDFITELLEHVRLKNINFKSKELCDRIEKLKTELNNHAQDEESLSQLENNLDSYKTEQIPQLNAEYFDFLEWLFFYLEYDTYPIFPEAGKELTTGMDIQTFTKNVYTSVRMISPSLEKFESGLKEKRTQLENNLNKTHAKVNTIITELKKSVDNAKEQALSSFLTDDTVISYLEQLKSLKKDSQKATGELQSLMKKEELLGAYGTEDDRIEQCQGDLDPMINYVTFHYEYRIIHNELDHLEIRNLDFAHYVAFIEKSNDLFDISIQKIPTLKKRISNSKVDFENFKLTVEISKYLYTVIDILKFEQLCEDNPSLFEDNNYYCREMVRVLFPDKDLNRAQEFLKNIKFKEVLYSRAVLDKFKLSNKPEVEKLVQEWESVKMMYDILAKIANEIDIDFKTENFKDKKYIIISHENYHLIKTLLNRNVKEIEDNMAIVEGSKDKVNILIKVMDLKSKLAELHDIIDKLQNVQVHLEKHMSRSGVLQKKSTDLFVKLKQAEKDYKILIDFIIEKPKIMNVLSVKDFFKESILTIEKVLGEIPIDKYDDPLE